MRYLKRHYARRWNDPMIIEIQRRRIFENEPCKAIAYDLGISIEMVSRYTRHLSKKRRRDAK